eukprot:s1356_g15.t1
MYAAWVRCVSLTCFAPLRRSSWYVHVLLVCYLSAPLRCCAVALLLVRRCCVAWRIGLARQYKHRSIGATAFARTCKEIEQASERSIEATAFARTCKEKVQALEWSSGASEQRRSPGLARRKYKHWSGAAEHRSKGVRQDLQEDSASIGAGQPAEYRSNSFCQDLQGDRVSIGAEQRSIGAKAFARTCKEIVQASERSSQRSIGATAFAKTCKEIE